MSPVKNQHELSGGDHTAICWLYAQSPLTLVSRYDYDAPRRANIRFGPLSTCPLKGNPMVTEVEHQQNG